MKKLLATLLVAVMIMSCMAVVSFAENASFYTIANAATFDIVDVDARGNFGDEFTAAYYAYAIRNSEVITEASRVDPGVYVSEMATALEAISFATASTIPAEFTKNDIVALPLYGEAIKSWDINIAYDSNYLEVREIANVKGSNTVASDKTSPFKFNGYTGDASMSGLFAIVYFDVLDDAKGDAEGKASTKVSLTVNQIKDGISGAELNISVADMSVNLTGLTPAAAEEAPKMEAEDVEAIETSKIVYAGEDTFANFKNAYGLGDEVAADYTEEMSYVCAFGTVDTTKEADEYGFKLTTSYGKVITGKAVNVSAEGKFGIVFYGADYLIEGATIEAYAIVDGAEI